MVRFSSTEAAAAAPAASSGRKEKLIAGATSAAVTATGVLSVFHLLVCPVTASIAVGSIAGSAATGALSAFEGGEGGAGFGSVVGLFIGGMGGWYAKTSTEPWSKSK
jgi:hypothetical protein